MKLVVFSVADKKYGAEITQVREVIRMRKVTPVPDVAPFVEGVISLRGKVIPLIHLRKKLGLEVKPASSGRIIVTRIQDHWLGFLVDEVKDVVTLKSEEVTQPDEILRGARYLRGVTKYEGDLVLVVDLTELLMGDEAANLQRVQEKVEIKKKDSQ